MKVSTIIIALILLAPCNVRAEYFEPFDSEDISIGIAATAITVVDLYQTLQFDEYGIDEQSSFLGDHPSSDRIVCSGLAAISGQWIVAWVLPKEATILGIEFNPRKTFQFGVIVGESWAVHHNYKIGVTIEF